MRYLAVLACLGCIEVQAQDTTEAKTRPGYASDVRYTTSSDINLGTFELHGIDTGIAGLQVYHPALAGSDPCLHLGNLGSAWEALIFNPMSKPGFDHGFHQFDIYTFQEVDINFYRTQSPFTDLGYVLGAKQEQFFNVLHTQNFGERLNVGFRYRRLVSQGFYSRQRIDGNNLAFFGWFQSPNERYHLLTDFRFNRMINQENGGVADDSFYHDTLLLTRDVVPVRLLEAENRVRQNEVRMKQLFNLGRKWSAVIDTTETIGLVPGFYISHTFRYGAGNFVYADKAPDTNFYRNIIYSPVTLDSFDYTFFTNEIGFGHSGVHSITPDTTIYSRTIWSASASHERWDLFQQPVEEVSVEASIDNIFLHGHWGMNGSAGRKMLFDLSGSYGLSGFNEGDYRFALLAGYRIWDKTAVSVTGEMQARTPDWTTHRFESNHFSWDYSGDKDSKTWGHEKLNRVAFDFADGKHKLSLRVSFYLLDDITYYDTLALPALEGSAFQSWVITARKTFEAGKFALANRVTWQQFGSGTISAPGIINLHSFYYQNDLFKRALRMNAGFDVQYMAPFHTDRYMPVSGKFYNNTETELSFYPVGDIFLNLMIKRVRISLKLEHATQGLFDKGYFSSPGYPMPDRAVKLGIYWMFFD